jgi:hypothetical protein
VTEYLNVSISKILFAKRNKVVGGDGKQQRALKSDTHKIKPKFRFQPVGNLG